MTKLDIEMRALNFNQKIMIYEIFGKFQVCIMFLEKIKWYEFKKKKMRKFFIINLEKNKPVYIIFKYFQEI